MSKPLEHDYIGLSEPSMLEISSDKISLSSSPSTVCKNDEKLNVDNLKETELRLGLPGSESPNRKATNGLSLFGKDLENKTSNLSPLKNSVSGAKRGFSDAICGTNSWDLSINGGTGFDLKKGDDLFSPKGGSGGSKNGNTLQSCGPVPPTKGVSAPSPTKPVEEKINPSANEHNSAPTSKAQVVGWPPIRSFRKNTLATSLSKQSNVEEKAGLGCLYVKVSMDGAPYLRKVDLKTYSNYAELSSALEKMFSCFTIGQCTSQGIRGQGGLSESHLMDLLHGSEYVLTYEDRDSDWMLVGDVPWEMFLDTCKRLRIMRSTDAIGLAPRSLQKFKNQN